MKHSKFRLFVGLLLVMTSVFSLMLPVAAAEGDPLYYIAFDNESCHDAIGNAYGFTDTEYINVDGDDKVSGAVRLTFEKSPYAYNGTYDDKGFTGAFDPYFYFPLYEIENDIKCEDVGAVVMYVRVQNKDGNKLKVNKEKPYMYFATDTHPIVTGQGDFLQSSTGFEKNSGDWTKLIFQVKKNTKAWNGTLQLIRLDPFGTANDKMDYLDVAGLALFDNAKSAKAFDCDFNSLNSDAKDEATSSFSLGTAFACIIAALGINGDLFKKKKIRTAVAIALVAVLALGLVACGGEKTDGTDQATATPVVDAESNPEDALKAEKLAKTGTSGAYEYEVYETYSKITRYTGTETDVTVPAEFEGLPVKVIGYKAFFRNYNLKDDAVGITNLVLPDSLVIIDDYALAGLEEAVTITFGKDLYKIGSNAIENCYSLKNLVFTGDKLRVIDSWAFSGDRVIEQITIPDGVTKIGNAAFQYCHSLMQDKLTIPASVTEKGKGLTFACTPMPEGVTWP